MRIAAISDIHGNLGALEAVLADIGRSGVDLIVNLGDIFSGPLFPAECANRLIPLGIPTVRGNHERQLLTLQEDQMGESDRYTANCLDPGHISWMAQLPESLWIQDDVLLVHGTPSSDVAYFAETVEASGVRPATHAEIRDRAGKTSAALILHGHTHIPRIFKLADGPLILNPGSIGLQAYHDAVPFPPQDGGRLTTRTICNRREAKWILVSGIESCGL